MKLLSFISRLFKKSDVKKSTRPLTDEQFLEQKAKHQKKLDQILDKVSTVGFNGLSKSEKEFLRNCKYK